MEAKSPWRKGAKGASERPKALGSPVLPELLPRPSTAMGARAGLGWGVHNRVTCKDRVTPQDPHTGTVFRTESAAVSVKGWMVNASGHSLPQWVKLPINTSEQRGLVEFKESSIDVT